MANVSRAAIAESIVRHGTDAVTTYRQMNGIEPENRVPEIFLGGRIAHGLYADTGLNRLRKIGRFSAVSGVFWRLVRAGPGDFSRFPLF